MGPQNSEITKNGQFEPILTPKTTFFDPTFFLLFIMIDLEENKMLTSGIRNITPKKGVYPLPLIHYINWTIF